MIEDKSKYEVIIVGSGLAGLVAANILADYNLKILLVDENIHLGGQLLRKIPEELGEYSELHLDKVKRVGFEFVNQVKQKKLTLLNKTILMGIYNDREILLEWNRQKAFSLKYDLLLLATGARERFIPFKGWTLPGVYSTGLVQVLMKSSGVLPARRMLIGGTGLFLLAAGYEYLKNGGRLLGIMEQSPWLNKIKFMPQIFHQFPKFWEGARYLSLIYRSRVPVKYKRKIVEARGEKQVEEVVVARVDGRGRVIKGTERTYSVEALAVGYGFVPNIEAAQLAGCELEYAREKGGWTVKVNDRLETSVPDILAAGEITGIGGGQKSICEGQLAAYTILEKLGKVKEVPFAPRLKKLQRERKHHLSFMKCFNSLYQVEPATLLDLPEETIICRCESVTLKDLKEALKMGCHNPNALKVATRCAMGKCQGRTCTPIIYELLQAMCQREGGEIGLFTVRPPLKPISLQALNKSSS
ncbi:MAG: FAD/NAD(P)-binding oxidoreductase [Candidatus Aminicenantes bacterium]|nr:MAG: FAD/NAD(P)-binding oxidoreductase [Candidatus Aminicenantes bacterium]RLE05648.1 MAG: FAD/NAD(P)-binding oxidoreductase [Candidatus Aminicenantes bacterium]